MRDSAVGLTVTAATVILVTSDERLPLPAILIASAVGLAISAYGIVHLFRRQPPSCHPADRVTLFRTILTGGVASLVTISMVTGQPLHTWPVLGLAFTIIVFDGIDGYVARRTGTPTAAGAQFDMGADALLLLVLSASVAPTIGWWTLLIGLMRYMFLALIWLRPQYDRPLPPSRLRKIIGLGQSLALLAALMPFVTPGTATAILAIALTLLTMSFGRDILTLSRQSCPIHPAQKKHSCGICHDISCRTYST